MPTPTTSFDLFDTIVAPFPFADFAKSKPRPALVLSARAFNAANGHTVLAMITTARSTAWPSDLAIDDLAAAGLPVASVVRPKLFTLPNELLARRIGALARSDQLRWSRVWLDIQGPHTLR
ncbi:MAG: type II toxin-antitoxin system PemK/MazF family toxin [Alphaproteobacteria bacterium]|nr:type II toxin-antitoxin system PemK/MazF family toxin [Alphaproteobacteria bacterium]